MKVPEYMNDVIVEHFPDTLTILTTYRCNAACEQCCFESNPSIKGRLSLVTMKTRICDAKTSFTTLQLVVFSGGECFLLKHDLFAAISYASDLGLKTRCVTNGFWGKTPNRACETVQSLVEAGVTEINISTGLDHQKWVPFSSVETAAKALVEAGIRTLVTIEKDSPTSQCVFAAFSSPVFKALLEKHSKLFMVQCNSWMPFKESGEFRGVSQDQSQLYEGCKQIFRILVVTPHDHLSACCGLTLEHIPEMKLGDLRKTSMAELFEKQLDDFLKIWIHVDGPATIITRLFGDEANAALKPVSHICQACAIMHKHPKVRDAIRTQYYKFVPEILSRFNASLAIRSKEEKLIAMKALAS